jgi:cyanophycinase
LIEHKEALMIPVFLLGGGWNPAGFGFTYGRVLEAATQAGVRRVLIVVAEEPDGGADERFLRTRAAFEAAGGLPAEFELAIVSAAAPLTAARLEAAAPTGIFVAGGLTPDYWAALCADRTWVAYLQAHAIPYAGFSAGASIAATTAIIGGWQVRVGDDLVAVTSEDSGEDLAEVTVQPGLGLVPFAVEVHASQWGTLPRLLHAVARGVAPAGWAIDEDTMLAVTDHGVQVIGLGHAYEVQPAGAGLTLTLRPAARAGAVPSGG